MDEIKVGDRIKDNDPRMNGNGRRRVLTVERVWVPRSGDRNEAKAVCRSAGGYQIAILLRRIYTDSKPRKSGFTLLREAT